MSATLPERYDALVASGAIERDPAQVAVVRRLQALSETLASRKLAKKSSALGWLFGRKQPAADAVKGLYIWGSVGRGKTMLMDLFYETVPVAARRRVHFHAFMADVHERIHAYRQALKAGTVKEPDPIGPVAAELAEEASLLCFDEFTVTDIADAMILGRLFTKLFADGVTVVATSNVEPSRLYEGGLNRALFLPFIELLASKVDVIKLDARTDFRLEKLGGAPTYHVPADDKAKAALDKAFSQLTGVAQGSPTMIAIKGHELKLPQAAGGVARASFSDLCAQAYGASDYLALAQHFHTLILDCIPIMDIERRNEAKRFIILIDTLYESHVKLVASAAAEPTGLYVAHAGREAFEFDRTVSRLIEMRSEEYLALPHGRADSAASGDATGLVET
ncbi:cell division protein ZapE [Bosea sp. (in: a-proteobacteria)]|jgi:cell division protein ZapE|uniref:cell division protein ZapE n=1 Tax=Bosea sp. (in: a-proteobacteria) TaxID=1871050 RepID=UPI002DDCD45E|nr:cell division protein ZapE [Bosea sp. (in: a-proteobacteria)]HEV2511854.1 cell division protein ZapE [Bosea sp. (in: a-proteobacteria)]